MKTQFTLWQKVANTPPIALLVLFVWLLTPSNAWSDVTDVTWDSNSGKEFPSSSDDTKSGITLTTNWNTQSGLGVRSCGNGPVFNFENAPTDNYIDITTDGKALKTVYVSIAHGGGEINDVSIAFSAADTYDGTNLATPSIITVYYDNGYYTGCNEACEITAPTGAKSARIHRAASGWGPYLHRIRVIAQDPSATPSCALSLGVTDKTVQAGESFSLNVSTAAGYDGEISYSVSPAGMVTLDNGTVTAGSTNGLAVITVTASTTENYEGDTKKCFVHVNNFAGTLTASEDGGNVTLNWFYNLPISLASEGTPIDNGGSYSSSTYADGVRTITYNHNGGKAFFAKDFKTPNIPNCKSFSFEYRGENNGTNPRVVPYAWLDGGAPNSGNIVANPVEIRSTWDEVTVIPSCNYDASAANINNGAIDGLNFASYPVGCVAFFPMANDAVSGGTLQLRNAYFQIINSNSLTSSVKLVRKDGSAPTTSNDGVIYTGAPTTYEDNSGLVAGHTYYYRLFVTYNDVEYASNAVSITMPGTAKKDPELSLPASSAVLKVGDTYTLEPTVASGYDGTLAYEITAGSDKISLSGSTITAEAAGTATVRVTAPETTEYNQVTANFTVTVLAVPKTNLAITNVDGDNVTLSWTIPGIIDLRTAKITPSSSFATNYSSFTYATSTELNNNGVLEVTYSANGGGTITGFLFDVDLTSIETLSFDYKGDYTGSGWDGIFPGIYNSSNGTMYWEGGSHNLAETTWQSKNVTLNKGFWKGSDTYPSGDISEIGFFANACNDAVSNGHMWLRNLRYHTTGMTDIDHIVIMRTTDAAATDTVSGTKLYSGRMFHYTDAALSSGMYYYTIFAVYEDGCFPVEYKTFDNRSFTITYKDQGDATFSGTHATGYPTTHKNSLTTELKSATKDGYAFAGWYTNAECTDDAIISLTDGYDADITLYARWIELSLHQPGKYEAPTTSGGYGRKLKSNNNHDYEVYMMTFDTEGQKCENDCGGDYVGELYAGSVSSIHDGYRMFSGSNGTETKSADGWMAFKPYKYYGSDGSCNIDEFTQLNSNSSIHSSRYVRIGEDYYIRLYVQGYEEFAFIGKDNSAENHLIVKINGITQTYTPSTDNHVSRFELNAADLYLIEITANTTNTGNQVRGFSLRLPDVDHYTVTVQKNENSYGSVDATSITNVRAGSATYITENTFSVAGTIVTATPTANNAQYTYAFDNWTGTPANVTAATTITANFTRTTNEYTLTWDLNGGTVTTAGTGAAVNATGMPFANVAFGTVITAPTVTKDGFQFVGWNETPASTMPAENKTYTAKWATPIVIGSGTTNMNWENVYSCSITGDSIVEFNVDGNVDNGDEKCVDIRDKNFADWWVKITRGFYKATLRYGTPSGDVKVKIMVVDPSTGEPVKETTIDEHYADNYFTAIWPLDLRDIDEDKTYYVRVIDAYSSTGSKPKVGSLEFTLTEPSTISNTAKTRLDYENVTVPYQIASYDIEQDGPSETCLYIGYQHQADWTVKINRALYKIRILYGKPSASTKLNMYILNSSGETVWTSEQRPTPSGNYELWEIDGLDLTTYSEDDKYTIRIKDTYGSDGSVPYIAYIDFIPKATHTRSGLRIGDYGTICLPYAVAAADRTGAELFEIESWAENGTSMTMTQLNENENMIAGRPYIFQATANTATFSYYVDGEEAEAGTHNGLIGSYVETEIPQNADNYIIYNNKLYMVNSANVWVGANRAYIHKGSEYSPAPANRRRVTMGLYGTQTTTDINQISTEQITNKVIRNGHLFILRGDKIYNAQGQLVQ